MTYTFKFFFLANIKWGREIQTQVLPPLQRTNNVPMPLSTRLFVTYTFKLQDSLILSISVFKCKGVHGGTSFKILFLLHQGMNIYFRGQDTMHTIKWTFSISKTNEEDHFPGKKKLLNKNMPLYLLILSFSIQVLCIQPLHQITLK